jgi:uncharacterized protein involved in exopolysaccharide biosynthesis
MMVESMLPAAPPETIFRSVRRHRKKAGFVFVLAVAAATAAALLLPKSYRSEGKLLVRLGKENATLDRTATMSQETVVTIPNSRDEEINSIVELIHSRVLAEKVVDALGPEFVLDARDAVSGNGEDTPQGWAQRAGTKIKGFFDAAAGWLQRADRTAPVGDRDRAIAELLMRYTVVATKKTNVIEIGCNGRSPQWAQQVVAKLIELYLGEHIRLHRPQGSLVFFSEQADRSRRELARQEEALRDLKTAAGVASPVEQRQALAARISRVQDDLLQADTARAVSESRVQMLRKQVASLPAERTAAKVAGIGNLGTDNIRAHLYTLQVQKEEAAAKYNPAHPIMRALEQELRASQELAKQEPPTRTEVTTSVNRLRDDTEIALLQEEPVLASSQAKTGTLRNQLAAVRGELQSFNESQMQIVKLERDVELQQAAFRKYATNLEQARIDLALETQRISNICVAQPATIDPVPVAPKKPLVLVIGVLLGLLGAVGIALLADRRDHTLRTPEDLQRRLGIPVLGSIPRCSNGNASFISDESPRLERPVHQGRSAGN